MLSVDVLTPSCMIAASCPRSCTNNTINWILELISLTFSRRENKGNHYRQGGLNYGKIWWTFVLNFSKNYEWFEKLKKNSRLRLFFFFFFVFLFRSFFLFFSSAWLGVYKLTETPFLLFWYITCKNKPIQLALCRFNKRYQFERQIEGFLSHTRQSCLHKHQTCPEKNREQRGLKYINHSCMTFVS